MVRAVALAGMLAGCYAPRPFPGAPCSDTHECPAPLTCIANVCDLAGTTDASIHDSPSGDSRPPDAAMPGPNGWFPATPVPGVNTSSNETDPSFTEDQLTLVFTSDRPGTGGLDLYIGTRTTMTDAFTVRELAELNTTSNEQSPEISPNGLTIYFVSSRLNNGTLYRATRAALTDPFSGVQTVNVKDGSGTTATNGNKNLVSAGIGPDGLEAILVPVKNAANQMLGYDIESSGNFDTEFDTGLELGTVASNPSISFLGTGSNADVYLNANTPAQIYKSTYTAGVGANGVFTTPTPIPDFNDVGTRNAAPCISAGGSFIMFERDGDIVQTTK